jgi:hypothetical protein
LVVHGGVVLVGVGGGGSSGGGDGADGVGLVARVVAEMDRVLVPWGSAMRMRTFPSLLVRTAEPPGTV